MTFTEAALEVLEREGRPMHAREIADKAVEWSLLSHVGKTPEQTMSARISAVVAKGKGPFARVRPGVFALAKWEGKPPGPSRRDSRPRAEERIAARAPSPRIAVSENAPLTGEPADGAPSRVDGGEKTAGEGAESQASKKRKRRRRKKRGDEETRTQGQAPEETKSAEEPRSSSRRPAAAPEPRPGAPEKKKPEASSPKPEQNRAPTSEPPPRPNGQNGEAAPDDGEITDRVELFLRNSTRPVPVEQIAKEFAYQGRAGAPLMEAILLADGLDREYRGMRPKFAQHRSGWSLAEREVSQEIVALESQVFDAASRLGRLAERQVLRRLRNLPMNVFARVITLYLRRAGFGEMRPVERGGADEMHLTIQDRRRGGRFQTAVVVRRDPPDRPVSDDLVVSLRGSLHRYKAMRGMMLTTGAFDEKARAEAVVQNLPPVALVDGETIARELVRLGIGVRERKVTLPTFDEAFFTDLGN